jgi:lipopolysaccharide transport system ATP-binding protein
MSDAVVRAAQISKKFCRILRRAVSFGMVDIGRNALGLSARSHRLREGEFWAVDEVSLELRRGEVLGIVGVNGSGKSTILKMLNGLIMPDRGQIEVAGRVSALIEVGAGFHPMLTGRENIYINGAILGIPRREIDRRFDSIVEFSGVEDAIDSPLKFYSSGMYVRLGFAVAAHLETDALLVDEVLAVGDAEFRSRCYSRIAEMLRNGVAIAFVSHNLVDMQRLCNRCVWLDAGRIRSTGETPAVISDYTSHLDRLAFDRIDHQPHEQPSPLSGGPFITSFLITDERGVEQSEFNSGQSMRVRISYDNASVGEALNFTFSFRTGDSALYSAYCSAYDEFSVIPQGTTGTVELEIPQLLLGGGLYSTCVGLWDAEYLGTYDWHWDVKQFSVTAEHEIPGHFVLPHSWRKVD